MTTLSERLAEPNASMALHPAVQIVLILCVAAFFITFVRRL